MSSLIFELSDDQAIVATDTLAVSPDGKAIQFTTKALVLPHLKIILASTGVAGFLDEWFMRVNKLLPVRGIDHLNDYAPIFMTTLWGRYAEKIKHLPRATVSIFHFGVSEITGNIHAYTYHSGDEFRSKRLTSGLAAKPGFVPPDEYRFPEDVKLLMDAQRASERTSPVEERIYIGGEIQVQILTRNGISLYSAARFDDYESDEAVIYERLQRLDPQP